MLTEAIQEQLSNKNIKQVVFDYILPIYLWFYVGRVAQSAQWLWAGWSRIESRWGRDFPPVQTGPGAHPASYKMGTASFPGVKCSLDMLLTTHPLLVEEWKS